MWVRDEMVHELLQVDVYDGFSSELRPLHGGIRLESGYVEDLKFESSIDRQHTLEQIHLCTANRIDQILWCESNHL